MQAPKIHIDIKEFSNDPYPDLARMRAEAPICFCPELGATLLTKREDIYWCEKNIDVFSSVQPGGLMTTLMGQNMMRKDGEAHLTERKQAFPSFSPRTVQENWLQMFMADTAQVLDDLAGCSEFDLVWDFAMPVSGNALRRVTGLENLTPAEMNAVSQGMIDGIANYTSDPEVEARCHASTAKIDAAIDEKLPEARDGHRKDMLSILTQIGQPMESVRANIKLAISGGQNEPRDAIAGAVWALLTHPDQLASIRAGDATWRQAFEEYGRWISPIGMSPRQIACDFDWNGVEFNRDDRVFLMFSSANRDEEVFENAMNFDILRDTQKAITFGAGPHFCAGAAVSRALISEVALPMFFDRFKDVSLAGNVEFQGWAFRGALSVPVVV